MQQLIGQVYNMEGFNYKKDGEERRRVTLRIGMDKPYKVTKTINGEKKEVREKTFVSAKCFNGLSETLEKYFAGDDNKGRWIQVFGHYEEEEFERTIEVDDPEDADSVLELPVKTKQLVFYISQFAFVGPAPEQADKPAKKEEKKGGIVRKKKKSDGVDAKSAEKELSNPTDGEDISDEDAPF
jgi:hypothetical protein